MTTVNIIKLAAGIADVSGIEARLTANAILDPDHGSLVPVYTRNMPKRRDELLNGGSLFWVAGGRIVGRSPFVDIKPETDDDGRGYCLLCVAPMLIRVQSAPKRAFQGWRYLSVADSPSDIKANTVFDEDVPADMLNELQELGLI